MQIEVIGGRRKSVGTKAPPSLRCTIEALQSFHFLTRFAAEQDVHLPRQRVRVAGGLQPEAALPVPQRGADDQHSAPWREHQQLT